MEHAYSIHVILIGDTFTMFAYTKTGLSHLDFQFRGKEEVEGVLQPLLNGFHERGYRPKVNVFPNGMGAYYEPDYSRTNHYPFDLDMDILIRFLIPNPCSESQVPS